MSRGSWVLLGLWAYVLTANGDGALKEVGLASGFAFRTAASGFTFAGEREVRCPNGYG
jgi:hypothetical protein